MQRIYGLKPLGLQGNYLHRQSTRFPPIFFMPFWLCYILEACNNCPTQIRIRVPFFVVYIRVCINSLYCSCDIAGCVEIFSVRVGIWVNIIFALIWNSRWYQKLSHSHPPPCRMSYKFTSNNCIHYTYNCKYLITQHDNTEYFQYFHVGWLNILFFSIVISNSIIRFNNIFASFNIKFDKKINSNNIKILREKLHLSFVIK